MTDDKIIICPYCFDNVATVSRGDRRQMCINCAELYDLTSTNNFISYKNVEVKR